MSTIKNVTVCGAGILGSQIAFQAAYANFEVKLYDISDDAITLALKYFEFLAKEYKREKNLSDEEIDAIYNKLQLTTNINDALEDSDLLIESIPEKLELKREFFSTIGKIAPSKTIFSTNSSLLLPSDIMEYTGRPEKFLALHFATLLYKYNIAEIMGSSKTSTDIFNTVSQFAKSMGMEPIEIKKEQSGYILNTLLTPLLGGAAQLLIKGVADAETIDKTWKIAVGAPAGPFEMCDIIGLNTLCNICMMGDANSKLFAYYIKANYIDKGKKGFIKDYGFYLD